MRPPRAMRMQSAPRRIMKQAIVNLRGRPHIAGACAALSDWEVDEARLDFEWYGTPIAVLAERYGVSTKTLNRAFKRMDERGWGKQ